MMHARVGRWVTRRSSISNPVDPVRHLQAIHIGNQQVIADSRSHISQVRCREAGHIGPLNVAAMNLDAIRSDIKPCDSRTVEVSVGPDAARTTRVVHDVICRIRCIRGRPRRSIVRAWSARAGVRIAESVDQIPRVAGALVVDSRSLRIPHHNVVQMTVDCRLQQMNPVLRPIRWRKCGAAVTDRRVAQQEVSLMARGGILFAQQNALGGGVIHRHVVDQQTAKPLQFEAMGGVGARQDVQVLKSTPLCLRAVAKIE